MEMIKRLIEILYGYFHKDEENSLEEYYNDKYPKQNITYRRIDAGKELKIDVRQFLNKNNFMLPLVNDDSDDVKAINCLRWVISNIKYTPDRNQFGLPEYWSFGYQTINYKLGDCEDMAILLYDIMRANGIPAWKIRLNAGYVINPTTKKKEGHAYITYFCEE